MKPGFVLKRGKEDEVEESSRTESGRVQVGLGLKFVLTFTVFSSPVFSAIPQKMHYQGYLTDSGGTPIDSSGLLITFSIYDSLSGGMNLWTEIQTVTMKNGIFNVTLGQFNPIDLQFSAPYYLGVRVGADEEMVPRTSLTSVGYAFRARFAETDHDALGSLSCSAGQIPKWNGSAWACAPDDAGGTYTAGTGLMLAGTQFSADTTYLQRKSNWNLREWQCFPGDLCGRDSDL